MKLEELRLLRGPNHWAPGPCVEAVVSGVVLPDAAAWRALLAALAPLGAPCGEAPPRSLGGFAERLAQLVGEFRAAARVRHQAVIRGLPAGEPGRVRLVVEHRDEAVGRRSVERLVVMVDRALAGQPADVAGEIRALRALAEEVQLGPSTAALAAAAERRGIPVRRLTDGSLLQLGTGSRSRRVWAAETDRTSAVAEAIAQDKELTKSLLSAVGLPVPAGGPVASADEAAERALALGGPVVVKPQKGNQGKGVSVGLRGEAAVRAAYAVAARRDGLVLVEQHIPGDDYRLLVVGDQLVAAARRDPPRVVGDGRLALHELVERENQDPRRGDDHATSLSKLLLDSIALELLAESGRDASTVPAAGEVVLLRRNANLSTGGSAIDVTDEVHPEVARAAVRAARVVGLDVAGIDVVAPTLSQPLEDSAGAIVEVNAAPGLRMHLDPSGGKPRPVGEAIVASMFAAGDQARVPVVAVTGTNGKTTTARAIAHVLAARGAGVGLTCTDGIYVRGRRVESGDCSGPRSARLVLGHPEVDVAVLETARGGILREGLGFDRCDVAVVTNIGEGDHLGMGGVATAEDLARVKGVAVRAVSPGGAAVLNASDPLVAGLGPSCPGELVFFSRDPSASVLVRHIVGGGRAVTVRSGAIVLIGAGREELVADLGALPLTHGGRVGFQTENLLATVGALAALGVPTAEIAAGLRTFESTMAAAPGRFNVLHHGESTVILDYGHNASALLALTEAVGQFPHRRRKIVYTAAGDRRDEDIRRQAELVARAFDEIWVYEDQCTRGRAAGEILGIMGEGFARVGVRGSVHRASGEFDAIDRALSGLAAGDLLLCQVDQVDEALRFVASRVR